MEDDVNLEKWATHSHETMRTASALNGDDAAVDDAGTFPFFGRQAVTPDARMTRIMRQGQWLLDEKVPSLDNLNHNFKELSREFERLGARGTCSSAMPVEQRLEEVGEVQLQKQRLPKLRNPTTRIFSGEQSTGDSQTPPQKRSHSSVSPCSERRCHKRSPVTSLLKEPLPTTVVAATATATTTATVPVKEDEGSVRSTSAKGKSKQAMPRTRGGRIRVVVRKRPLPPDDVSGDCIAVNPPSLHIAVRRQRVDLTDYEDVNDFSFDDAFDETKQNIDIFDACGRDLLTTTLEGGSASCFAYGQTGSGKTHTMIGNAQEKGLYILVAAELFTCLSPEHVVYVSLYEIYCNSLFDLLNSRALVVMREDQNRRVNICGLTWHRVNSAEALWSLINSGTENRSTSSTAANEFSSRSHAVVTIQVRRGDDPTFCGTLNFVDLAGNERAVDTAASDRQTRQEGAEINKSLLALKECIRALDEKKKHVPFRGSKLTEILRDSFVGNSHTVMIANVSASSQNYEHTVNTLRYAFRVKGLSVATVMPNKARNLLRPLRQVVGDVQRPQNLIGLAAMDTSAVGTSGQPSALSTGRCGRGPSVLSKRRLRSRTATGCESPGTRIKDLGMYLRMLAREKMLELLSQGKLQEFHEDAASATDVSWMHCLPGDATERVRLTALEEQVVTQLKREIEEEVARELAQRDLIIKKLRHENASLCASVASLEKKLAGSSSCVQEEGQ